TSARTCMSVPGIPLAAWSRSSGLAERFQYHITSSEGSEEIVSGEPQPEAASGSSPAAPARRARRDGRGPGGPDGGRRRGLTVDSGDLGTLLIERRLNT